MFHLLLCVTENIKQSHAVRGGRFWIEFQPSQGNLDHTYGTKSPTQHFPFLSSPWIRNTLPDYRVRPLCTRTSEQKIKPTSTKRVNGRSTRRSNQVLKLTNYHISRHVASTFKCLTKWATPRDLSHFDYTSGVSQLHNPAVVLIFQHEFKVSQFLNARERQEITRLLPFLISRATIDKKIRISNIGT